MIFGYSTNAFVKFPLLDSFDRIARLGFAGVEIMCDQPHLYPPEYDAARLAEVKAALEKNGLTPTNLNSFTLFAVGDTYLPSWIEPEAERRKIRVDHTLACLDIASRIGCGNISVPPGGPLPAGMTRQEALRLFHAGMDQVIPKAEELGVRLLIEPEPDLLMERTAEIKPFVAEIQAPIVGINFDIGHFFCAGEDPAPAFEELFPWIGHIHIEDIAPTREHNHLIAGLGAIDFPAVFRAMQQCGYRYDMSLELYPYTDRPEEAGRQSREYLLPMLKEAGLAA
ncbi:AP endonuclease [Desulfosarcina ovata subsp. sediminis]|uniref:AP endonuclease n=1 Tax=Desulfosarcina ovata subsp. sediminis TaxID=885957 RepID=A0A5K7ZNA8_9BACT|nr:sugar phosphate isomerase/epimerase family protein [Desulfosarcina ovata]BBO82826.1 AP endonuclease [Desulfosarcina ovata subsp. sediminis]